MPGASFYKHYARVYVTKGAFVSASASNVIAIFDFKVSDIRVDAAGVQSDTVENTADILIIRPDLEFTPDQLVITQDTNNAVALEGLQIKLDFLKA